MGIANFNLHPSQQRQALFDNFATVNSTGNTYVISMLPNNALVTGVFASAIGISNTPVLSFFLYRFLQGTSTAAGVTLAGFTSIGLGATLTVPVFGTSGIAFYGPTMSGNTISSVIGVTGLIGDLLVAQLSGSNAAITTAVMGAVVKNTDALLQWPE